MEHKPIRVLHVIGHMDRGGSETMIMNLYRHIDRARVQFDFVENSPHHAAYDDEILSLGGRIYRCPHYNGKNHFTYQRWWDHFFREHGSEYAIVHGHLGSTAAIYLSAAKKHGIYTIAHSHSTNTNDIHDRLYQAYAYPTRFIADFFFGCSLKAGEDRYGKRVTSKPEIFTVFNNAIDTEHFRYNAVSRNEIRVKYGIETNDIVFGHAGRFCEPKNHTFLIDIFHQIHRRQNNTRLLLVGTGDLEETIRQKTAEVGLSDAVIFAGVQDDVAPFYQAMDVFLLPSLFEGLPLVLVEAQCSGLPCVISDRVPLECALTDDLISVCKLSDGAGQWAEHALSRIPEERFSRSEIIAARGYDIGQTAKWLADFYCEKAKRS